MKYWSVLKIQKDYISCLFSWKTITCEWKKKGRKIVHWTWHNFRPSEFCMVNWNWVVISHQRAILNANSSDYGNSNSTRDALGHRAIPKATPRKRQRLRLKTNGVNRFPVAPSAQLPLSRFCLAQFSSRIFDSSILFLSHLFSILYFNFHQGKVSYMLTQTRTTFFFHHFFLFLFIIS